MPDSPSVFLSHSSQDHEIADAIRTSLERAGIRCWIAPRDIQKGETWEDAIVRGIRGCKVVLCLISVTANTSKQVQREIHVACEVDDKVVIPIRLEDVQPSGALAFHLSSLQWFDAISRPIDRHLWLIVDNVSTVLKGIPAANPASPAAPAAEAQPGQRAATPPAPDPARARPAAEQAAVPVEESRKAAVAVTRKAVKPQRVALLYRRSAQPDDYVLGFLEAGLSEAGHDVFVDRHMSIGVEWVGEIERQVRQSDAVIPLLSPSSVLSEMLSWEVKTASSAAQQQMGKPRILPVRVGSEAALPEPFHSILGRLQYAIWRDPADDANLLNHLLDGLDAKEAPKVRKGEVPGGAVPLDSRYYIVRPTDIEFYDGLERQDGLLLVKGARQMGKTSLLARGLQKARDADKTVVFLDLQNLNQNDFKDLTSLYKALGGMIADKLKLDVYPEDKWRDGRAPNINFANYIVREVMNKTEGHVVIAMDEVDRLFSFDYTSEIFGMFRSWFNARTVDTSMPWGRLTQAFVYATEPLLFITDEFQSPFNVGTKIELKDFEIAQVKQLNDLYDQPIRSDDDIERFYKLFSGQPYLTRRGFYELTRRPSALTLDQLVSHADMDDGPFGDHLRRILILVARDKKTLSVVSGLVHGQPVPDQTTFYNLRSSGLISGHSPESAQFRCSIYETYLKRHLGRS
jgi:hypothetical protein